MKMEQLNPMEPNEDGSCLNPYLQDHMLMGMHVAPNVEIMGSNLFTGKGAKDIDWFVIVNKRTGERVKITITPHEIVSLYEPRTTAEAKTSHDKDEWEFQFGQSSEHTDGLEDQGG